MDRLDEIRQDLRAFVAERDWEQFHDPKNLAMAVVSEAGELAAEYRWISNAEADDWSRDPEHRNRVAREAADVAIALLLFFDRIGVDALEAVRQKLELNRRHYPVAASRGRAERPKGIG
ncbi:MAG TPA: nucleotide pyrophosphohydrolase [Gemmatimonadales bacterium]|nr:nucleotide pyrophosphohydrolase [Gemmatimonadales bacterium]